MKTHQGPGILRSRLAALLDGPLVPGFLQTRIKSSRLKRRRQPGSPELLPDDLLGDMCSKQWNSELRTVWHSPISSWKGSSASYVWLELADGTTRRIVTKATDVNSHHLGAASFPVVPGRSEFWVYAAASDDLSGLLPNCYGAAAGDKPGSYFFMLEDLSIRFGQPPQFGGWTPGLQGIATVHEVLGAAVKRHPTSDLLCYDGRFQEDLVEYGLQAITRFSESTGDIAARTLVDQWDTLRRAYLSPRYDLPEFHRPIHGDFNTGNIFVALGPSRQMKVVDWEWAGVGLPHLDYAAYLRRAPAQVLDSAVDELVTSYPDLAAVEHELLLRRSLLERSIWDASLLTNQAELDGRTDRIHPGVRRSLEDATRILPTLISPE